MAQKDALFRYVGSINQASPATGPNFSRPMATTWPITSTPTTPLCLYGVLQKGLPGNVALSGLYFTA